MLFIVYVFFVIYVWCQFYKLIIVWILKEFNLMIIKFQIVKNVIIVFLKIICVNF